MTMNLENPYQPSQVARFHETATVVDDAWTPEEALGPKWLTVCKGAANCHTAVAIPVVAMFIAIGLGLLRLTFGLDLGSGIYTIFGLAFLYAWVMQIVGLVRMGKVSRATGAKGLLVSALILFILYWVVRSAATSVDFVADHVKLLIEEEPNIADNAMIARLRTYRIVQGVLGYTAAVTYVIYNVVLVMGIRRIGIALGNDAIRTNIMKSLWLFIGCVIVIPLFAFALAPSLVQANFNPIGIAAGISSLVAIYIMLSFYAKSIKMIADYAKMFAPAESVEENPKAF